MPNAKHLNDLRQSLQQETNLVIQFIALLEEEAGVLAEGAAHDALTPVTEQKNEYALQLEKRAAQRNACLAKLGYGIDKAGLEAAIGAYPDLLEPVRQLLDCTAQASILNTGNGRIITRVLSHNQQALDVLQHLTGRSDLYDASGRKRPTSRPQGTHIKAT